MIDFALDGETQGGKEPKAGKNKGQRAEARCPLRLYPSRVSPDETLLVERVEGQDARFGVGASARRVDTNHCIFLSAEAANAGLVDRKRNGNDRIAYVDATHNRARASGERISALTAGCRVTVVGDTESIRQAVVELGTQAAPKAPPRLVRAGA